MNTLAKAMKCKRGKTLERGRFKSYRTQ
uniref:Uncharacterized protein n=1 Tax=Rhizophora mucronata TaxID=61149 RepID=A0A2P2PPL1_RHIMU